MKDRLDKMLVNLGLASTRSQALNFIKTGAVYESGVRITKPSYLCDGENLEVRAQTHYVGRGALKLLDALEHFQFEIDGKIAADIGASTGGFTQVLLEKGAAKVYAVDVGTNQLDHRLKSQEKVVELSGTNIRELETLPEKIQVMVADLSFISLELVLPAMKNLLAAQADMVVLVKPQFEVGKSGIDKNGLVKSEKNRLEALYRVFKVCESLDLGVLKATRCSITGKTGNQEYLYWLKPGEQTTVTLLDLEELSR
tara:strand:+ start:763 stop:1527 length:765 start_codon:yes stop_codon:yes gene_type:complete